MVITWKDFEKVAQRAGTIIKVEPFKGARKPAYILHGDLGKIGVKKSSVQITKHYKLEELLGKQVICVTNFEPKQIGPIRSEVLLDKNGDTVLSTVDMAVPNGQRLI